MPDSLDDVPGPFERLEPAAAREPEIPRIVWVALLATLFSGGIIVGLVLGIVARRQIRSSDGRLGGLALANLAIALNLVPLIYILVVIVPSCGRRCRTGSRTSRCHRDGPQKWRQSNLAKCPVFLAGRPVPQAPPWPALACTHGPMGNPI